MEKIDIIMKIKKDDEEEIITNVIGEISDNFKKISYYDEQVMVVINLGNQIIMKRTHPDYELTLIFDNNNTTTSVYKINNPVMEIEVEIETKQFNLLDKNLFIEYFLKLNGEKAGLFKLDLSWINI